MGPCLKRECDLPVRASLRARPVCLFVAMPQVRYLGLPLREYPGYWFWGGPVCPPLNQRNNKLPRHPKTPTAMSIPAAIRN